MMRQQRETIDHWRERHENRPPSEAWFNRELPTMEKAFVRVDNEGRWWYLNDHMHCHCSGCGCKYQIECDPDYHECKCCGETCT